MLDVPTGEILPVTISKVHQQQENIKTNTPINVMQSLVFREQSTHTWGTNQNVCLIKGRIECHKYVGLGASFVDMGPLFKFSRPSADGVLDRQINNPAESKRLQIHHSITCIHLFPGTPFLEKNRPP